jgi:hypothetical protein
MHSWGAELADRFFTLGMVGEGIVEEPGMDGFSLSIFYIPYLHNQRPNPTAESGFLAWQEFSWQADLPICATPEDGSSATGISRKC